MERLKIQSEDPNKDKDDSWSQKHEFASFLENARYTVQPHDKLGKNWMSRDH